jgi:hypothetical protein
MRSERRCSKVSIVVHAMLLILVDAENIDEAVLHAPIALGRLSPAKASDTFFILIRPELYRPDFQSHLAAQVQTAVIGLALACLRPLEGNEKFRATFLQCQQIGQKRMLCIN